jgi:hypothetical protein
MGSGKTGLAGSCSGDFHGELASGLPWSADGILESVQVKALRLKVLLLRVECACLRFWILAGSLLRGGDPSR